MARRLPAALTTPELVKPSITRSSAASIDAGARDLVADQPALRRIAIEPAAVKDRLARDAVAGETPQPQIGRARDDALLARRQRHIGVARRQHVIERQQKLAAAADGKALDDADPRFLDRAAGEFVGALVRPRHAAEQLVDEPHVALDVPDIGNLAAIEVRQVDAGREQVAAAIFRVLHGSAAQHRDIGVAIERGDVDRDFEAVERGLVLGVEKPRIAHGHDRRLAAALKRRAFERERALFGETPAMFGRLRPRQQHGVTQMHAGRGMGEDMRQQQALIDLGAVLVALFQAVFARQFLVVGHQTRQQRRRLADQMLDADEFREIMRQAAINRFGMGCAENFPAPSGRAARSRRRRMLAPRSARACPAI